MPLSLRNLANSSLVNAVALSDTITSGRPSDVNDFRKSSIVAAEVAVVVGWMSSHLECASVTRRNIFPSSGPA